MTASWEGGVLAVRDAPDPDRLAVVQVDALTLPGALVATAGHWSVESDAARFHPSFPPVPGTVQAVVSLPEGKSGPWTEVVRVAVPTVELVSGTRVERIDPEAGRVPENLLRISISFSAPMEEGSAAGNIRLVGADGHELVGTLLAMPPELWDRSRRRLTVLLEPGRIKRGLQPHTVAGPPLTVGSPVTVVVDEHIRDATGARLVAGARRTYQVTEPIRSRVDPKQWRIGRPATDRGQLVVRFDRPMDRALVTSCLTVTEENGGTVQGRATLDEQASTWTFRADRERSGGYRLRVHPDLEDLAGNSVRRVFDRDLEQSQGDST